VTDWNQYKGDPHNSGLRRDLEGPSYPAEAWTADLTGSPGSPVLDRDTVYVGTTGGNYYALERATGRRRWVFETAAATDATPVVTRDRLFVGTADGTISALDPATGEEEWRSELPGPRETARALRRPALRRSRGRAVRTRSRDWDGAVDPRNRLGGGRPSGDRRRSGRGSASIAAEPALGTG